MKFTALFVFFAGLLSLTTAVTIRGYGKSGCKGASIACNNIKASTCCPVVSKSITSGSVSGGFHNLPGKAVSRGYQRTRDGRNCGALANTKTKTPSVCMALSFGSRFAGFAWFKPAAKRDVAENCESIQKADQILLEDGTEFGLDDMDDGDVEELWILAMNGSTSENLPSKFLGFLKK